MLTNIIKRRMVTGSFMTVATIIAFSSVAQADLHPIGNVTYISSPPTIGVMVAADDSQMVQMASKYLEWFQNNIRSGALEKADRHWTLYKKYASLANLPVHDRARVEQAVADGEKALLEGIPSEILTSASKYLEWYQNSIFANPAKADDFWAAYTKNVTLGGGKVLDRSRVDEAVRRGEKVVRQGIPSELRIKAGDYLAWFQDNLRKGDEQKADQHWTRYTELARLAGVNVLDQIRVERAVNDGERVIVEGIPSELRLKAGKNLSWFLDNTKRGYMAKADEFWHRYKELASLLKLEVLDRTRIEGALERSERALLEGLPSDLAPEFLALFKQSFADGNIAAADRHWEAYSKYASLASIMPLSRDLVEQRISNSYSVPQDDDGRAKIPSNLSGLPWASGMSCMNRKSSPQSSVEAWRGHKMDVLVGWAPRTNHSDMLQWLKGSGFSYFARSKARPVLGLPLLTEDTAGQHTACAMGKFDALFKEVGRTLVTRGKPDTVIRLGWEANGSWYPWSIGEDPAPYKACFRRAVDMIRSTAPDVVIDWPLAKMGHLKYDVRSTYPGDDVVDIISISFYDRYPVFRSQEIWDAFYMKTYNNGPYGLGQWLAFARERGKKLGIGEWGINDGYKVGQSQDDENKSSSAFGTLLGFDNAFFIEKTYKFFRDNAHDIAYESYYNCQENGMYRIYPESANPMAGATYKRLWRQTP